MAHPDLDTPVLIGQPDSSFIAMCINLNVLWIDWCQGEHHHIEPPNAEDEL